MMEWFWSVFDVVWKLGTVLFVLASANFCMSALIWLERRSLALYQDRRGPNRVGPFGVGHVVADTIKIFFKEDWVPPFADKAVFVIAPVLLMSTILLEFALLPIHPGTAVLQINVGVLFFLALSSLSAYSVMLAGWASANQYSLLGALRASSQLLSYEVFMGLSIMGPVAITGSFNLEAIVEAQETVPFIVYQPLGFMLFLIAGLAEAHRAPFDLVEADSELVAGFHTEYSGIKFGMFFLGEYLGVTLLSGMITTLYLGGWNGPFIDGFHWFALKTFLLIEVFILARAALPRPRPDQLLVFGWTVLFPAALLNLLGTAALVLWLDP